MPPDHGAFERYVDAMVGGRTLAVGEDGRKLGHDVLNPPVPMALQPAAAATRVVTAGLLPEALRQRFEISWTARERAVFRAITASTRVTVRGLPQAVRYWPHYRTAVRRASQHGKPANFS